VRWVWMRNDEMAHDDTDRDVAEFGAARHIDDLRRLACSA